jgi:Uma2 family endonuclease
MTLITDIASQPRLKLTFDDVLAMMEKRIIDPTQKYELIDGVIYQMAAEGIPHRFTKSAIIAHLAKTAPDHVFVMADATLNLSPHNAPSPDAYVVRREQARTMPDPEDILLVIEVSESSLNDDLGPKADLYAAHGVQEYWVVDIERELVLVHREREGERWATPKAVSAEDFAICAKVPELKLRLADLRR